MEEGKSIMSLKQNKETEQKIGKNQQANVWAGSSALRQMYSRRIYRPEVDQSNRTAKQKVRWWRHTGRLNRKKNYWTVKRNKTQPIKDKPWKAAAKQKWKVSSKESQRWGDRHQSYGKKVWKELKTASVWSWESLLLTVKEFPATILSLK